MKDQHLHSFYRYNKSENKIETNENKNEIDSENKIENNIKLMQNIPILFFDLDNTLYSKSTKIGVLMGERITLFFQNYLKLPLEESEYLGRKYYLDYGLAIRGLIKDFNINPLEYDSYVDGGLPLEEILNPHDHANRLVKILLRELTECRKWIFTNAGLKHAMRVLKILQLEDYFEGIIYCDYCEPDFPAKPQSCAFERAMFITGAVNPRQCYFVDDSPDNVRSAMEFGWNSVLIDEEMEIVNGNSSINIKHSNLKIIRNIQEIKMAFPELINSSFHNDHDNDNLKMDYSNVNNFIMKYNNQETIQD